jgi:hypothetical protein
MVHKLKKLSTNERIKLGRPLEVWQAGGWTWEVYRKYQKPAGEEGNPYARWFCKVRSPFVPEGEFGDVYVHEIKNNARKVSEDKGD